MRNMADCVHFQIVMENKYNFFRLPSYFKIILKTSVLVSSLCLSVILLQGILGRNISHKFLFGLTFKRKTCLLLREGRHPAALPRVCTFALLPATEIILNLLQNEWNPHMLFIVWKSRSALSFLELCPISNVGWCCYKEARSKLFKSTSEHS